MNISKLFLAALSATFLFVGYARAAADAKADATPVDCVWYDSKDRCHAEAADTELEAKTKECCPGQNSVCDRASTFVASGKRPGGSPDTSVDGKKSSYSN